MKAQIAFITIFCLVGACETSNEDPQTPLSRPSVQDVLATFEADQPKSAAFNRLSEAEKWEFLRVFLPNRVFSVGPSDYIKFQPGGTATLVSLFGGHYELAATLRWEISHNELRLRPATAAQSMPLGLEQEEIWQSPEIRAGNASFSFATPSGRGATLGLLRARYRSGAPDFLNEREQWPLLWARMYPEGDEGLQ